MLTLKNERLKPQKRNVFSHCSVLVLGLTSQSDQNISALFIPPTEVENVCVSLDSISFSHLDLGSFSPFFLTNPHNLRLVVSYDLPVSPQMFYRYIYIMHFDWATQGQSETCL